MTYETDRALQPLVNVISELIAAEESGLMPDYAHIIKELTDFKHGFGSLDLVEPAGSSVEVPVLVSKKLKAFLTKFNNENGQHGVNDSVAVAYESDDNGDPDYFWDVEKFSE